MGDPVILAMVRAAQRAELSDADLKGFQAGWEALHDYQSDRRSASESSLYRGWAFIAFLFGGMMSLSIMLMWLMFSEQVEAHRAGLMLLASLLFTLLGIPCWRRANQEEANTSATFNAKWGEKPTPSES